MENRFVGHDVSVVIPTHDRPERVVRAAKSVDSQSATPGELIVVNDGSNKSYKSVEEKIEKLNVSTKYIKTEGLGAPAARNVGARHANGEVLMFLDDDDLWTESKIKNQLGCFNSDIGLVYSGRTVVDQSGQNLYQINGGMNGDLSREILIKNIFGTTSGPAIRSDIFKEINGFDESMPGLQDWELWIRICQKAKVEYDPSNTVKWTLHDEGSNQMTGEPSRYKQSIELIKKKHNNKYQNLSFFAQKKARSNFMLSIANSYDQSDSNKQYLYYILSILQYPSLAAIAGLFPRSAVTEIREKSQLY
jgi:glycosyltransferase involved in cell wall biosynthesis